MSTPANLWDYEEAITSYSEDLEIPPWIDQGITPNDVAAILQGGCESGAYMPAVLYHQALETMSEHGDRVLTFLEEAFGELPHLPYGVSWSGMAVFYLSAAVELWASRAEERLLECLPQEEE